MTPVASHHLPARRRGFTIVELMVVVAMLSLLAAVMYPALGSVARRAEEATCSSRLKRLHGAFSAYLIEHQSWPQIPLEVLDDQDWEAQWKWWHDVLEPYGVGRRDWLCPVEEKAIKKAPFEEQPQFHASYIPTTFDAETITPHRWQQPWLIERGDFHNKGPRLVMPSGDVIYAPFNPFAGN